MKKAAFAAACVLGVALATLGAGCSKPDDALGGANLPPNTGKALNPSGQVTQPAQQQIAKGQQASGESANKMAAQAAAGFKAAGH